MNTVTNEKLQETISDRPGPSESGPRIAVSLPEEINHTLVGFLLLEDGWGSYKAPKPTTMSIASAFAVLQPWHARIVEADADLEIAPALDGGVDLSFDLGDRWVSVLLKNSGVIEIERSDGEEAHLDSPMAVDRHLFWLFGKK